MKAKPAHPVLPVSDTYSHVSLKRQMGMPIYVPRGVGGWGGGAELLGDSSAISPKQHDTKGQNETPHKETTNIRSGATFS